VYTTWYNVFIYVQYTFYLFARLHALHVRESRAFLWWYFCHRDRMALSSPSSAVTGRSKHSVWNLFRIALKLLSPFPWSIWFSLLRQERLQISQLYGLWLFDSNKEACILRFPLYVSICPWIACRNHPSVASFFCCTTESPKLLGTVRNFVGSDTETKKTHRDRLINFEPFTTKRVDNPPGPNAAPAWSMCTFVVFKHFTMSFLSPSNKNLRCVPLTKAAVINQTLSSSDAAMRPGRLYRLHRSRHSRCNAAFELYSSPHTV
jgi:hypothetical protein